MGRQGSDENQAALEVLSAAPFSPGSQFLTGWVQSMVWGTTELYSMAQNVYRGFIATLESETIVLITPEPEKSYCHIDVSFKRNKLIYLTPVSCWEKSSLINQILVYTSSASLINIIFTCISKKTTRFLVSKTTTCFTSRTGILESGKSQYPVSLLCCKRLLKG